MKLTTKFLTLLTLINHCFATNYICTRLYCDSSKEASLFPNSGSKHKSSDSEFQNIYWKCICVMFASSNKVNKGCEHLLFTNKKNIPKEFRNILEHLRVKVVILEMRYKTPAGFYDRFKNTFYILDAIKYLSKNLQLNDKVIFIDSDCIWMKSINPIIEDINKFGLINYECFYPVNYNINSLTRTEYKEIYGELLNKKITETPTHFGAEILASDIHTLKRVASEFDIIWQDMLNRFQNSKKKFVTEEHLLSYIYYKLNLANGVGGKYIKRMWTTRYNNLDGTEHNLTVWHLPAEKNKSFNILFNELNISSSQFNTLCGLDFSNYCLNIIKARNE